MLYEVKHPLLLTLQADSTSFAFRYIKSGLCVYLQELWDQSYGNSRSTSSSTCLHDARPNTLHVEVTGVIAVCVFHVNEARERESGSLMEGISAHVSKINQSGR